MFNVSANELQNVGNIAVNKELKLYDNITFLNSEGKTIKLSDYKGNLVILNFWATWCVPCREEMPSLDLLKKNKDLRNLEIFPINIGKDSLKKTKIFFKELKIENLKIYFDNPKTLAKDFSLRGVPTSILINKEGKEFARILGSIDFTNKEFLDWIKSYN
tara:strand:- start:1567 stop:2046 length:480 start_codon:yes stop_codon:yes gene_type:complete